MRNREQQSASRRPARSKDQHWPFYSVLRPLVEDRDSQAIGMVLSSTASDGVLGLKAIKGGERHHARPASTDGEIRWDAPRPATLSRRRSTATSPNLLASVGLPMLMLSDDLPLRHLTPRAQPLLNASRARWAGPSRTLGPWISMSRT